MEVEMEVKMELEQFGGRMVDVFQWRMNQKRIWMLLK